MISTFNSTISGDNSLNKSAQKLQEFSAPHLSLSLQQDEQSQQPKAHQLNLLVLQELPQELALYIEPVHANLTVGFEQRFWLVHQPTGLRLLGQFGYQEAKCILEATKRWDWEVDLKTREPACRYRLLWLLESICKPSKALEVTA